MLRQPSAIIPLAMSIAAIATILVHLLIAGTAPQPDEGSAAHFWQLLMAGQLPFIAFYALKWLPRDFRRALRVLAAQACAALAALAPIYLLGW